MSAATFALPTFAQRMVGRGHPRKAPPATKDLTRGILKWDTGALRDER